MSRLDAALAGLPLPTGLHRRVYRLAFELLKLWWFVRRPTGFGACVAVHDAERVLVVQVSYRAGYTLPGGGIMKGETARAAALRELREEIGLRPKAELLQELGEVVGEEQWRRVRTVLFAWRPGRLPTPRVDGREVVWAGYKSFAELRGTTMTPGLRWLVGRAGAGGAAGHGRGEGGDHPLIGSSNDKGIMA